MTKRQCHQELWLPSGHFFVKYDYWPPDSGDRSHNPPLQGEVHAYAVLDLSTGQWISEEENFKLFEQCNEEIFERLHETEEDKFF